MKFSSTSEVQVNSVRAAPIERRALHPVPLVMGGVQKSGAVAYLPRLQTIPHLPRYGT